MYCIRVLLLCGERQKYSALIGKHIDVVALGSRDIDQAQRGGRARVLEDRFEGGSKRGGIMSIANKVRYWEMYREMFDRISSDSDDNFRELFGEQFATAYEEQMKIITKKM